MSFENKGAMVATVVVTSGTPDRSGNFVIGAADPAVVIEAAWTHLATFGGGNLITKGAGETWTFQTQCNSQGDFVTWISDWSLTFTVVNGLNDDLVNIGSHEGVHLYKLKIDGNSANQTTGSGVNVEGGADSSDFMLEKLYIEDCKLNGIRLMYAFDGRVLDCKTNSNLSSGIELNNNRRVWVTNHLSENNTNNGILLYGSCRNNKIINPECTGSTGNNTAGIKLEEVQDYWNYIEGGHVYDNRWGLWTWNSQYLDVKGLHAIDNEASGIRLDTDDTGKPGRHKLTDCVCDGNGTGVGWTYDRSGICLDDVIEVLIDGCLCRGNSRNGITLESSAVAIHDVTITGCVTSGNTLVGIKGYGSASYSVSRVNVVGGESLNNGTYGVEWEVYVDSCDVRGLMTYNNTTACVNIGNANCDNNLFSDNTFFEGNISDAGTGTRAWLNSDGAGGFRATINPPAVVGGGGGVLP